MPEDLRIEDFEQFKTNNYALEECLNRCGMDVSDIIANNSFIIGKTPEINSAFSTLHKVKPCFIDDGTELKIATDELAQYFKERSVEIIGKLCYAEYLVDAVNKGLPIDSKVQSEFQKFINNVSDTNAFWILYEITKERMPAFEALAFLAVYGTDFEFEGGNFVIGDGIKHLAEVAFNVKTGGVLSDYHPYWCNKGIGTTAVVIFTALAELLNDKGELTDEDLLKISYDSVTAGLQYFEWVAIYYAIGGVPGVIVATIAAIPTAIVIDEVKKWLFDLNEIDCFEYNGKTYKVLKNGTEDNKGSWDVILENYEETYLRPYSLKGKTVSASYYYSEMYRDWTVVFPILSVNADKNSEYYSETIGSDFELLESILEKVRNAESIEEIEEYERELSRMPSRYLIYTVDGEPFNTLYECLCGEKGFNLYDYYYYHHPDA